ncbi:MAG: hypothetical protein ABIS01_16870, partial [Ferruginibacter sp.]
MPNKKKILIISGDEILAYQPSILNLYDYLLPFFDVSIVTFLPAYIGNQKIEDRNVIYLRPPAWLKLMCKTSDFFLTKLIAKVVPSHATAFLTYRRLQLLYLKKRLPSLVFDEYIAVDIAVLAVTQQVFGNCHFF